MAVATATAEGIRRVADVGAMIALAMKAITQGDGAAPRPGR